MNRLLELATGRDDDAVTTAADAVRETLLAAAIAEAALIIAQRRVDELHDAGTLWDARPMATAMARRNTADIAARTLAATKQAAIAALRSALIRSAVTTGNPPADPR